MLDQGMYIFGLLGLVSSSARDGMLRPRLLATACCVVVCVLHVVHGCVPWWLPHGLLCSVQCAWSCLELLTVLLVVCVCSQAYFLKN